jgi:signal transduction histidine kinase
VELLEELENGDMEEVRAIIEDLAGNEEKIKHHGKRADGIVKGMLQHSRTSSGIKEAADVNELADEYLRLAYHGMRAKDKSFNADYRLDADESLPAMNLIPQDFGRVLLNLINNAFYACAERNRTEVSKKTKEQVNGYRPEVVVMTRNLKNKIEICVSDNGNGIPEKIRDKIFQPFFTTKPTGEGTGLGLSLSYDIITKGHGGDLKVETREGIGTSFIIELPLI